MSAKTLPLPAELQASVPRAAPLGDGAARLVAVIAALAFALGWTLLLGRTFHWDAINYHFYLGFAALHDRFAQDFFAAGTPSYINPYAYVPLHLLRAAQVPAVAAAALFAAVHASLLWLTFELGLAVAPSDSPARRRQGFALLAMVLAALGPVLLQGLGLTLVDIPLGALVVAGWLALVNAVRRGSLTLVVAGAALGGVAAALKLSNAFYAVAALAMLGFFPGGWRSCLRAVVVYALACGAAFVVVAGPWAWKLWQAFGNPLFPFLNHVFGSPDFTTYPLHYERFRPADWSEFVLRPFHLLSPLSLQHTEGRAPDMRFAALLVALIAWAGVSAWGRFARTGSRALPATPVREEPRVLAALALAFVVAWCLWLQSSANSRYFIPMASVAAVLLAALLQRAYGRWKDGTLVVTALLLLAQAGQVGMAADWQRNGLDWNGPLLNTQSPDRIKREPWLFLSTSFLSGSAFLPDWHPESGMMTISGFYALGPDRPGWDRARALIDRNRDRLRILSLLPPGFDETTGLPGPPNDLDVYVARFGLAVDPSDCEYVKLEGNLAPVDGKARSPWSVWLTCRLRSAPEAAERYAREVKEVDLVFDRVESVCPNLFHPPRPVTEQMPRWARLYNMGSEIQLWIDAGHVHYFSTLVGGDAIDVGSVEAWRQGPQPIDCSQRSAPAWGGLLLGKGKR